MRADQTLPPAELLTVPVIAAELRRCSNTIRGALRDGRIRPDALAITSPGRAPMPVFRRDRLDELAAAIIRARN